VEAARGISALNPALVEGRGNDAGMGRMPGRRRHGAAMATVGWRLGTHLTGGSTCR
jgi:hypothetical protein